MIAIRHATAVIIACVALVTTGTSPLAQAPARGRLSPPPTGSAVLSGSVVVADSAQPVRLATVVVIGAATGTSRVTMTDASGRFTAPGLPADRYSVAAGKRPFLGGMAGSRRVGRPGTPIALADGQRRSDVVIRLWRGAAISGVITDERGRVASDTSVMVWRWRTQGDQRVLDAVTAGTSTTDEQGRYRIYGLPQGDYVVSAFGVPPPAGGTPRALTDSDVDSALKGAPVQPPAAPSSTTAVDIFFPGTPRASDATTVTVAAAEERTGVDVRLMAVNAARVEGVVVSTDGQPLPSAALILATQAGSPARRQARGGRSTADGRFAFANVPPGSYTLWASGGGAGSAARVGAAPIEVTGSDQIGLQVTVRPPMSFAGTIGFDGMGTPPPGYQLTLRSLTTDAPPGYLPRVSPAGPTGSFTISNLAPGRYVFAGASGATTTWAVQAVTIDGRDVTDVPFDVGDAAPASATVSVTNRVQSLSGRLTPPAGALASDYTVVIFPSDKKYWLMNSRRIAVVQAASDGTYTIGGTGPAWLPPGSYLLGAITDLDLDGQFDWTLLTSLVPTATPVTIRAGERAQKDLTIGRTAIAAGPRRSRHVPHP